MKKILFIFLSLLLFLGACKKEVSEDDSGGLTNLQQIIQKDTLVVATMYGSSSYFIFKGEEMGFDYELCSKFAADLGVGLKVVLANSTTELTELLENHEVDMIAYRLPITNELKQKFSFAKKEYINNQVLVQRISDKELVNVVDLIGKPVYVNKGSKFEGRLRNLNAELGGGINIVTVDDSSTVDDLIELVSKEKIDYTVSEKDVALLNKTYFKNIDCTLPVSFKQRSSWAVRKTSASLDSAMNTWYEQKVSKSFYKYLYNKYFVQAKYFSSRKVTIPRGAISPYDALFKRYARRLDWDWQMLASIAYNESKFDSSVVSWVGARGIMQMMPRTAEHYGYTIDDLENPEISIKAATQYLKYLDRLFLMIEDKTERMKFIIASYNSGPGHVLDGMALARKYRKNDHIWFGSVETYVALKRHKEYYSDPVVRSGYFRSGETVRYVVNVLDTYERYKNHY